jgi:hypothetical protein
MLRRPHVRPALARIPLPSWAPQAALAVSLAVAWINFLFTAKWAYIPGALHGGRKPWYAAALVVATALAIIGRRHVGRPAPVGRVPILMLLAAGVIVIVYSLLGRLPLSVWSQFPFKDDWTPLFQATSNGVSLLRRGVVVGWNWWFMGGYPTSTDIAQSFALPAFIPMALFGERLGYHVFHAVLFLIVPVYVWWDLRHEDRTLGLLTAAFGCIFAAGLQGPLGGSGDTNSLVGLCATGLALVGSRAAHLGRRWGGPVQMLGLIFGLYSHVAFFAYAVIYLIVEAVYFRDRRAAIRLVVSTAIAGIVALPVHWESLRYPAFVSFNNVAFDPASPVDWPLVLKRIYYNVEILAFPHRWLNDYRSLSNIWLPALLVVALQPVRSRAGYYAWAAIVTQALLRVNTPEAGALFDRIQHMLPMLAAPALAAFVLRFTGTRKLATALMALIGLYVLTSAVPIPHVRDIREFDPPLIDRLATLDGNMVLVEINPHRDMDSDPNRRSQRTPFDVHFEALLPRISGQRFYSQMWDGYVWNSFRGQVVGGGTFRGRAIEETPAADFVGEMHRWGVRHLLVWTDQSRGYLARSGFVERWRGGLWSHFELPGADVRSVVTSTGTARLTNLDFLGGDVELSDVRAGEPVVVRANYYPAWRAYRGDREVPLYSEGGQLAFRAPEAGSYTVRLVYPRYGWLSVLAVIALLAGAGILSRMRFGQSAASKAADGAGGVA